MRGSFYTQQLKFDCDEYTKKAVQEQARRNSMTVAEYLRAVIRKIIKEAAE